MSTPRIVSRWVDGRIEVDQAPQTALFSLNAAINPPMDAGLHVHAGRLLVFGTPGLGVGRIGYLVTGWDAYEPGLTVSLVAKLPEKCEDCRG